MRQNPLRDHRSPAVGLHVPLYRLPAFDKQRLLLGDRCRGERLSSQRDRAATAPAHGRQRTIQHPMGLPRLRLLGMQSFEGRRYPRAGRHARRYLLAATDPAYLDSQQAALDHLRRGRSDFRGAAARVAQRLGVWHTPMTDLFARTGFALTLTNTKRVQVTPAARLRLSTEGEFRPSTQSSHDFALLS